MEKIIVSFITPTKERDFRIIGLLESIKKQNYSQEKVEIIIVDGGSIPEVLEVCEKYGAKIYFNEKIRAEGAGMGKDQGIWKANGKYIVIAESDIELVGENWINNMIEPLEKDESLFASVPRLYVYEKDNVVNRYLSYIGVDPFAIFRSIEGQLALGLVEKKDMGNYYKIMLNKEEPFCMGSNGFCFRRDLIKQVGDYVQDVEFIARIAKANLLSFAIPKYAFVFHKNVKNFVEFFHKRIKWAKMYSKIYVYEKKYFVWINKKSTFLLFVCKNLLFFPNIYVAIRMTLRYKDLCWLLHPLMLFLTTFINIIFGLQSKHMLNEFFKRK